MSSAGSVKSRSGGCRVPVDTAARRGLLGVASKEERHARSQRWTLVLVRTAVLGLLSDITVVSVALPSIQRDLHAMCRTAVDECGLCPARAMLMLPAATLGDRLGRRRLFLVGQVTCRRARRLSRCSQSLLVTGATEMVGRLRPRRTARGDSTTTSSRRFVGADQGMVGVGLPVGSRVAVWRVVAASDMAAAHA